MTNSGNVFCVLLIEEGVEMKSIRREREKGGFQTHNDNRDRLIIRNTFFSKRKLSI